MVEMTGRERILATIRREEPDRVPVSPRAGMWLIAEYGDASLATQLGWLPDVDLMHIVPDGTPNTLESAPDEYSLRDVTVVQEKRQEGDFTVADRTFRTPAGTLSDRTRIPGPVGSTAYRRTRSRPSTW